MSAVATAPGGEQPYYARRDDSGHYTYKGRKIRSVTTYQGFAPGGHLMKWYGSQSAMKCLAHLIQAGYEPPAPDEKLDEFCAGLVPRSLTKEQAWLELWNHQKNAIEAERYRDWKARIGSLGHHFIYSCALEGLDPRVVENKEECLDWLRFMAIKLNLFFDPKNPDFQPTESMLESLANSTHAYVCSSSEWLLKAKPRWTMIGQEAVVIRKGATPEDPEFDEILLRRANMSRETLAFLPNIAIEAILALVAVEYAGTVDAHMELIREDYGYEWDPAWPTDSLTLWADFKHSNSINHQMVQAQVSAYEDADCILLVATGEEFDLPKADFIASLHIGPHPSQSEITDEFGTLQTKAKQLGAKLWTYPRSSAPLRGFHGLTQWVDYCENVPKAHQQLPKATSPKPEPGAPRQRPF